MVKPFSLLHQVLPHAELALEEAFILLFVMTYQVKVFIFLSIAICNKMEELLTEALLLQDNKLL